MALDKLPNALIDMLVVMGLDESTGIITADTMSDGSDLSNQPYAPFCTSLSPQILAALSSHVALFPSVSANIDESYPPRLRTDLSTSVIASSSLNGRPQKQAQNAVNNIRSPASFDTEIDDRVGESSGSLGDTSLSYSNHRQSVRRKLSRTDFAPLRRGRSTVLPVSQLPLSDDILRSLMTFCFPDNYMIHAEPQPDLVHHLVLTNVLGTRSYATCLTHFRRRFLYKGRDGMWRCQAHSESLRLGANDSDLVEAYVPTCYVIISNYPYFTTLKDCLSRLLLQLHENNVDWERALKEFTLQLSSTPVSVVVDFQLEFQLFGTVITLPSLSTVGRHPVDYNLGLVLQFLDVQTILFIFTALLLQQRIVFLSSSYALLVLVSESFMRFLYPFRWQLTYVPLLPMNLLELVEAPGSFVMGCHSKHWQFSNNEFSELVVVDIDQGTLRSSNACNIPCLPKAAMTLFKESVKSLSQLMLVWQIGSPTSFSYEKCRAAELENGRRSNDAIDRLFLDLMVNLFGSTLNYINCERGSFQEDRFLKDMSEIDRPFYENVFKTELFKAFLNDRRLGKKDAWTDIVNRSPPSSASSHSFDNLLFATSKSLNRNGQLVPMHGSQSMSNIESLGDVSVMRDFIVYRLPNFMYGLGHKYIDTCLKDLSEKIMSSDPFSVRHSAYLYLRGTLRVSLHKKIDAIDDFCQLYLSDRRTFTMDLIDGILASMTKEERSLLEDSDLFARTPILKDYLKSQRISQPVLMELNEIPEQRMNLNAFIQSLEMLKICPHRNMAESLFRAFAGDQNQVDPATFEEFYKGWKQNEAEVQQVVISKEFIIDPATESILKVSGLVKCTCGNGRIVLTQDRLLFIQEGSNKWQEIVQLSDILRIDQRDQQSFFRSKSRTLEVIYTRYKSEKEKRFVASFREDSDKWFLFINEMWSGKRIFDQCADPSLIASAKQNVLIIDAFLRSGEIETSSHHSRMLKMAPSLCYYMGKLGSLSEFKETCKASNLLRKLNVSADVGSERLSVDALLFTHEYVVNGSNEAISRRLWCALANQTIQVYNARTWQLESNNITFNSRLTCLLQTRYYQVWAGSFDSAIYVIDNRSLLQQSDALFESCDVVSDMTLGCTNRLYSACLNGQILVWDSSSKKCLQTFRVPMEDEDGDDKDILRNICCRNNVLLCGTRRKLYILSLRGDIHTCLLLDSDVSSMIPELKCFLVSAQNELWIGMGKIGQVRIYDLDKLEMKTKLELNCRGVSTMVAVDNEIWIGSKQGVLYIYDAITYKRERKLEVHTDRICCLCAAPRFFVFSGPGSIDGKIGIWKWPINV